MRALLLHTKPLCAHLACTKALVGSRGTTKGRKKSLEGKGRVEDRVGCKHTHAQLYKSREHVHRLPGPSQSPEGNTPQHMYPLRRADCSSAASGAGKKGSQNLGCQYYDKKQTLLNSTPPQKKVKIAQQNARQWERSGTACLITLGSTSFDRGELQRKCVLAFTENIWELTWGNLLSLN